jgi:predicted dithiol-disulfide oxidoreductase (DUF899 family)
MNVGRMNGESEAYRQARDALLEAEIALRDQREAVAAQRRKLPRDTAIDDYVFQEGPADLDLDGPVSEIRLSDLLGDSGKPLIVYQYMYGAAQNAPCPMCTMWVDGFNGTSQHIDRNANFAVVAQTEIDSLRSLGRRRGWHGLRLLSSAGSTFKTDLNFQNEAGRQFPGVSVFGRVAGGSPCHFYSASALMGADQFRGIDLLSPVWNLLDLTPEGRGDWEPSLAYD